MAEKKRKTPNQKSKVAWLLALVITLILVLVTYTFPHSLEFRSNPQQQTEASVDAGAPAAPQAPAPDPEQIKLAVAASIEQTVASMSKPHGAHHLVPKVEFDGDVSPQSAFILGTTLAAMQDPKFEAIVLVIDSQGGEVHSGYLMARAIQASRVPVYCVVDEKAESMAFYVLQSCKVRIMTTRSFLMIHEQHTEISADSIVDREYLEDALAAHDAIARSLAEMGLDRIAMTIRQWRRKVRNKNWYVNWPEAKRLKMVDLVVVNPEAVVASLSDSLTLPRGVTR